MLSTPNDEATPVRPLTVTQRKKSLRKAKRRMVSRLLDVPNAESFSIPQLAFMFGVSDTTIRNWLRAGRLDTFRVGKQQEYRVLRNTLAKAARGWVGDFTEAQCERLTNLLNGSPAAPAPAPLESPASKAIVAKYAIRFWSGAIQDAAKELADADPESRTRAVGKTMMALTQLCSVTGVDMEQAMQEVVAE